MTISALLAASESLPVVDIDNTIFLQAILFLALFLILQALLFKPWLEIRERRTQRIGGAFADAEKLREQADEAMVSYESRLARAREQAIVSRSDSRRAAEQAEAELVAVARSQAAEQLDARKRELVSQTETARAELQGRVDALAGDITQQILGRSA